MRKEITKSALKAMIVGELTNCFNELILLKSSLVEVESRIVSEFKKKVDNGVFEEIHNSVFYPDSRELNYVFKLEYLCSRKELKALMNFTEKRKIYFELESLEQGIFCRLKLANHVKTQFILDSNKKQ